MFKGNVSKIELPKKKTQQCQFSTSCRTICFLINSSTGSTQFQIKIGFPFPLTIEQNLINAYNEW